jgi:holliday junction DNA helicase RuvA
MMIDYIKGNIIAKQPTHAVIDVNGIGYGLSIPLSTYLKLSGLNSIQQLFCWLYVRDDALELFGFFSIEERDVFKLLLTVSGVGPRMALGVLSAMDVGDFLEALRNENLALLVSVPGIGKKKAERMLLELKDKVKSGLCVEGVQPAGSSDAEGSVISDAVAALTSLGCGCSEAAGAVKKACKTLGGCPGLEKIIKEALKWL